MIEVSRCSPETLKPLPAGSRLGFGQYFSDHWFYSKFSGKSGWYESKIEPYGPIPLDPAAAVLHYGQALFEGMKAFAQPDGSISLFRPGFNFDRLREGAARLCLEAPPRELFMAGIRELIQVDSRWLPKEKHCALYIRPTLIGIEAFLGVRPSREIMFYIILSPVASYYGKGGVPTRIWVEDQALRAAPGGLGAVKAGANYAASLQAAHNAKAKGYDQVLWLDTIHEGIEEVGTMNVFFVFKNEVVTPALNGSILAGGMRDSVIQWLGSNGIKVNERRVTIGEVIEAVRSGDLVEAFGTGTAAVVSPIGELYYQGRSHLIGDNKPGELCQRIFTAVTEIQYGRDHDQFKWMIPLTELG